MSSPLRYKESALLLSLFLVFPLLWMAFLTQNLPFSTMDDPTLLYMAKTTPLQKILSRIANPMTPTWSYQFEVQGGAEQNSLGLRPVELLIWKTLLSLFGYNPSVFYFLKAFFLFLVSLIVFCFTRNLTEKKWVAILICLFYAATLPAFMSVLVISDFGLLAQFIQGLSILLFLYLLMKTGKDGTPPLRFFMYCVLLYGLVWLGTKTYETVKILPPLFLTFMCLYLLLKNDPSLSKKRYLVLMVTILLMFILVVPLTNSFKAFDRGVEVKNALWPKYHWDTLYRFVLQNTRNAWEPEKDVAFFSFKSYLPFSLARTLGFFLCWIFVFTSIYAALRINRLLKLLTAKQKTWFGFIGLWLLVDFAAMGLAKESDARHLMPLLIPLSIYLASCIFFVAKTMGQKSKKLLALACIIGWAFAFSMNLGHQTYFRKFLGGITIAQAEYLPFIYKDYKGRPERSYEDLIDFMEVPKALCVWHIPFIVDDLYGDFDQKIQPENLTRVVIKYGRTYVVTSEPSKIPNDSRFIKLASFDEINDSLFTDWVLRFKKKRGSVHSVYRFIP